MHIVSKLLLTACLFCSGCATVGPASISNGRGVYNEVINNTEDEQLLNVIVRERYDQTFGMLTVASVTASIKVSANVSGQVGVGPTSNYAGNLVPIGAGVAYEESPTISYVPLSGEVFLSRMLTPITLPQALLLLGAAEDQTVWFRQLYRRINTLENPADKPASPKLERFFTLQAKLRDANVLATTRATQSKPTDPEFCTRISGYGDEYSADVREVLDILDIKNVPVDGKEILLPISQIAGSGGSTTVHVQLRSALDVIRIAGQTIEIPEEQQRSGVAPALSSTADDEHRLMTIHTSKSYPRDAVVAIQFRGWWYYIDATDTRSKRAFKILRLLVGLRMQDSASDKQGPIITIPAR